MMFKKLCIGLIALGFVMLSPAVHAGNKNVSIGFAVNFDGRNPTRAIIKKVKPNSPADNAGLKKGEMIIAIFDCAIPGCKGKDIRKLMKLVEGKPLVLTIKGTDGSVRQVTLMHPKDKK